MKFNRRILLAVMAAIVLCDPAAFVVDVSAFTMPCSNTAHRQQQKQQSTSSSFSGSQLVYHTGGMSSSLSSSTKLSMMTTPSGLASSSFQLASSAISAFSSSVDSVTSAPLFTFFAERVIESAVPAAFSILVIFFFFAQFKGARGDAERDEEEAENINAVAELYDDLYGSTKGNGIMSPRGRGGFGRGFQSPPLPKNLGLPKKEYIRIRSLNELYSSYDYSVRRATTSKAQAASVFRRQSFDRALNLALNADPGDGIGATTSTLSGAAKAKLLQAERTFLKEGKSLVQDIQSAESDLAELTMNAALSKIIMAENKADTAAATVSSNGTDAVLDVEIVSSVVTTDDSNITTASAAADSITSALTGGESSKPAFMSKSRFSSQKKKQDELLTKIADYQKKLKQLELTFIEQVISVVGAKRGLGLRNALLGDIAIRGTGSLLLQLQDRPLSTLLNAGNDSGKDGVNGSVSDGNKRLFVMNFPGDVQASQLNELREEVTAIVRNSKPGDEALVVLQSGGGTVTGYGLAAGQLVRLKEKGLKLTIAVEQVAASGGYMMSCVADKIIASPFAVLGSIGVISEIPNVYDRLKEEGIEFQTVTAGKFKRTLTPTKKVTREDMTKSKEDIESIFQLFKGWVAQNRPQLNIEEVATGETWFGPDALERGLCDEIKTVDDVLLDYVDAGYSVYEVAYDPPPEVPSSLGFLFANEDGSPEIGSRRRAGAKTSLGRRLIQWVVQSFAEEVKAVLSDSSTMGSFSSSSSSSTKNRYMARDNSSENIRVSDEDLW